MFSFEIIAFLKVKILDKRSYDKQNFTPVVISYEPYIYEMSCFIKFISHDHLCKILSVFVLKTSDA